MIVQDDMWQGIPLIHFYDEKMDAQTPVVIFLHGFLSAKEHNLHYGYQLVKKGIRVLLPDAYLHGDRSKNMSETKMTMHFWEIVIRSIYEVETLYEELKTRGIANHYIGIAGTSMGGITTFGCLKKYHWISSAAICMGAPGYNELADFQIKQFEKSGAKLPITDEQKEQLHNLLSEYDITKVPEVFQNRPILFWHGQKDDSVPFEPTYNFYLHLRPYYEQSPEHIQFIVEPNEGHKVNRQGVLSVTDWLVQHLKE